MKATKSPASITVLASANGGPNYSQLLIQAQEQRCLANKLINLKPRIDNKEPKRYSHLNLGSSRGNGGGGSNALFREQEIAKENSMLLKKMLNIIKRKNQSFREGAPIPISTANQRLGDQLLTAVSQMTKNMSTHKSGDLNHNGSAANVKVISCPHPPINITVDNTTPHEKSNAATQVIQLHPLSGTLNYFQRKREYENI